MINRFVWVKRKPVAAVLVCAIIMAASIVFWPRGQVAEAAILDPHLGLVGWWRFDEGAGTIAEDSSGYGNDGTIYGATWVDGKYGKALSFDGTDDYVDCGNAASLSPTNEETVIMWVKPSAGYGELYPRLIAHDDYVRLYVYIDSATGRLHIHFYTSGGIAGVTSSLSLGIDTWTHVAFLYDGDYMKLYLNGVLYATSAKVSGTINSAGTNLAIGNNLGKTRSFKGVIDEVRVYNRALSAAEIQEVFEKGPDFSSRLLAKVPKGTTQFIVTLTWQGLGSISPTIESPSKNYTEDTVPVYQRTIYSSGSGDMLNIKRLAVSVTALPSDENWYVVLEFDDVEDYRITVEIQK